MLAFLLAISLSWEAGIHFTYDPPRKGGSSEGAIHVSGRKVRIEQPSPIGPLVTIFDGRKLWMLRPDKQTYFELPASEAPYAIVPPTTRDGMKQLGPQLWEKDSVTPLGKVVQRLTVRGPDLIWTQAATRTKNGATLMEAREPRKKPQPDSLFRVPKNYTKSTSP
jgi:hypothetical protein